MIFLQIYDGNYHEDDGSRSHVLESAGFENCVVLSNFVDDFLMKSVLVFISFRWTFCSDLNAIYLLG